MSVSLCACVAVSRNQALLCFELDFDWKTVAEVQAEHLTVKRPLTPDLWSFRVAHARHCLCVQSSVTPLIDRNSICEAAVQFLNYILKVA